MLGIVMNMTTSFLYNDFLYFYDAITRVYVVTI